MRTQKRYTKRFEIEAEINKYKRKAEVKIQEAQLLENASGIHMADAKVPGISPGDSEFYASQSREKMEKADALRKSANTIIEGRIPELSRTLAAFQTQTLIPGDDQGVVLQK